MCKQRHVLSCNSAKRCILSKIASEVRSVKGSSVGGRLSL